MNSISAGPDNDSGTPPADAAASPPPSEPGGEPRNAAATLPVEPPPHIPDHELLRSIARGSYGMVWLARNMMGQYRAVKIVFRQTFQDHRPFERELAGIRRFEPISRSHEGFVDLLQFGINPEQGYFYYIMELGDDQSAGHNIDPKSYAPRTLASDIRGLKRISLERCLELGIALSRALTELHRQGLVHRDIKPSNIIFVAGVPKLADIGLVSEVGGPVSYAGTDGFIPPEGPSTPQADVYALGKVLYEAATGKDRQDFPELPLEWAEGPERVGLMELNEVLLRACQQQPARRYRSASELHADLVLITNGRSVKRLRALERRWAYVKRIAGISAAASLLAAAAIYPVYREHRDAAEARERQIGADLANGNRAMTSGDLLAALPWFVDAIRLDRGQIERLAQHQLRLGSVLALCPRLLQLWAMDKEVEAAEFSADGRRVLAVEYAGQARVFDTLTGTPLTPPFGPANALNQGAFSPDGDWVVTASLTGNVATLWRVDAGAEAATFKHPAGVRTARFSPDGRRLVTSCTDHVARIWNVQTRTLERELQGHTEPIVFAAFSPDGRTIVTTSQDNTARLWDASSGRPIGQPLLHPTWVRHAAFSPDGTLLVTSCFDHKAHFWETATGRAVPPDLEHRDAVLSAQFSPDGRFLVTAGMDREARLWLAANHQPLLPNPVLRHPDRVTYAGFAPDGHRILTACVDGTLWIWDLARAMPSRLPSNGLPSADGGRFLTRDERGMRVWDSLTEKPVSQLILPPAPVRAARPDSAGRFVVVATHPPGSSGTNGPHDSLQIWQTATGETVGPPLPITNALSKVVLSPDGQRLVVFTGPVAACWNTQSGARLARVTAAQGDVRLAVFSPNSRTVVMASGDVAQLWNSDSGAELVPHLRQPPTIDHLAFDHSGSRLILCGSDASFDRCQAQVWDVATGRPVGSPLQHEDGVLFAAFNPDGSRVATTSEDYTAAVWDTATGRRIVGNLGHDDHVNGVAFSPDGQWLFTAATDRNVRVWNPETGAPLTPPVPFPAPLGRVCSLADGRHILACDRARGAWTWALPVAHRPLAYLASLSQALSANVEFPLSMPRKDRAVSLRDKWLRLRAECPEDFTASPADVASWHEFQADVSQGDQLWFAAAFHLERLHALRPDNPGISARLAEAKARLNAKK